MLNEMPMDDLAMLEIPFLDRIGQLAKESDVSEFEVLGRFARAYGMRAMSRKELESCEPDFDLASFAECQRRRCVIGTQSLGDGEELQLILITCEPERLDAQQYFESLIEQRSPESVVRALVLESDFESFLQGAEKHLRAMDSVSIDESLEEGGGVSSQVLLLSMAAIEGTANSTVRLVDSTLYDALKIGASDIHFETQSKVLHIKYRLDGVLQSIKRVDSLDAATQVISRIKVLADLDISERRIPQDGRFRVLMDHREIDFRVSVMPNISGEDAVLRILDRKHLTGQFESLSLDTLSFEKPVKDFIRKAAKLPYGLLLVTGPTGSGKTTTLYAALSEINTGLDKIITIEDPIEYQLSGVLQIPVNEKKGLSFETGLRSILRHDPDKIMVGEIRDPKTAGIAVQAALTGHQVFTTVHANNVFDAIGRFANMGVDSYSLVAALTGIMAQRLVRTVCQKCSKTKEITDEDKEVFGDALQLSLIENPVLRVACGCSDCRGTGYKGRAAIAETLYIDDEMKDLLVQQAPISVVKAKARDKGFRTLRDSAMSLALRGLTTIEEINRVTPIQ